jgi:hypothetical protein
MLLTPPLLGNLSLAEVRVVDQVRVLVGRQQHQLAKDFPFGLMTHLLETASTLEVGLPRHDRLGQTRGGPTGPHLDLDISAQLGEEGLGVIDLRAVPGPVLLPVLLREPTVLIHVHTPHIRWAAQNDQGLEKLSLRRWQPMFGDREGQ